MNSRFFNLYRDYSKSLTLWNVGEPSKGWIPKNHIQVQKEGGNFVVACVLPLYNVKLGQFHVVVVQWRQRNVPKSVMHVQSCCFGYYTYLLLWRSRCRCCRRRRILRSLLIGALGNLKEGDGGENVTWKVNPGRFTLHPFLVHLTQFVNFWRIFVDLISKRLYLSLEEGKENFCYVFTSFKTREISKFQVVVVQRRQRKVLKAWCTCRVVILLI